MHTVLAHTITLLLLAIAWFHGVVESVQTLNPKTRVQIVVEPSFSTIITHPNVPKHKVSRH